MGHSADDFVERLGGALTQAGMPRSASLAFAALLADDDGRMTAAELAERLQLSAGSVSGAVNYLVRVSFIRRERERGSRRDVYAVDDDAWHRALARTDRAYAPIVAAMESGLASFGPDSPAHLRLVLAKEFLEFINREMATLMVRWEEHRRRILDG